MLAIDDIAEVIRRNRLRWFGHVERRDELCWIKRIETLQVDGDGVKGRPRKRWREVLKEDMRKKGLCREDAWDRSRWTRLNIVDLLGTGVLKFASHLSSTCL